MIGLIQPIALLGLLAIAGPVVVHLLRRRQGRRIVVPSLQLVPRAAQSAVHARQFSDVALMIVRLSIVACACFALAGPLLLTDARLSGWNGRIAKAIVVDQRSAVQVNQLVTEAERASAYVTRDFADVTLSDALRRAGRWLRDAPPAQREVVVLSDFRHGSLTRGDLDGVPPGIGIRFVELREQPATSTTFHGTSILVKGRTWQQTISLDGPRTSVRLTPEGDTDAIKPVRIDAPGDAARRLWNVVMAAGSSLPTGSLVLRFGDPSGGRDTVAADEGKAGARGDAARAALTLLSLPAVAGIPVRVTANADELVVETSADPRSLDAAVLMQAALDSWRDRTAWAAHEVVPIAPETLRSWSREPAPVDEHAWRRAPSTDARWLWATALLLLGVEAYVRRSPRGSAHGVRANAA